MRHPHRRVPGHQRGAALSSLGSVGRRRDPQERAPRPAPRLHPGRGTPARSAEHGRCVRRSASPLASKSAHQEAARETRAKISDRSEGPSPTGPQIKVIYSASHTHDAVTAALRIGRAIRFAWTLGQVVSAVDFGGRSRSCSAPHCAPSFPTKCDSPSLDEGRELPTNPAHLLGNSPLSTTTTGATPPEYAKLAQ